MLDFTNLYIDELNKLYPIIIRNQEKYKYWIYESYNDFKFNWANDNDWNRVSMVSIGKDNKILGHMTADIQRYLSNKVSSVSWVSFYDEPSAVLVRDCIKFIDNFFKTGSIKVRFQVVIGNPAEKMYDKFIKLVNGREIGILKNEIKLVDGKWYDVKMYEILSTDYTPTRGN